MAAQNDPSISESPSILHSPSQSESLSSKFLRKSNFLLKSNVNVEGSVNCSPSTNDLLPNPESSDHRHHQQIDQQPPSEMAAPAAESDIKPVTPTGVVLDVLLTTDDTLQAANDLQNDKDAAFSTPLSPVNRSPPSPLMEIIPPPLSHQQLQVTTPLESATPIVASSNNNSTSTQELQSLSKIHHTPCRLYPSWHFPVQTDLTLWPIVTESQIDDAKSLVLDLLGWGVDPEYLVTSGVHPELIYRIFTDLNLRLPTNLVLSDNG